MKEITQREQIFCAYVEAVIRWSREHSIVVSAEKLHEKAVRYVNEVSGHEEMVK